eukprot:3398423-Alexandrium_andersonii.AAC.1
MCIRDSYKSLLWAPPAKGQSTRQGVCIRARAVSTVQHMVAPPVVRRAFTQGPPGRKFWCPCSQ